MSMNSFKKYERKTSSVKQLNALYLDIDCYNKGYTKPQVIAKIDDCISEFELPTPSYIIDSGRGLYIVWKLKNESYSSQAYTRWKILQRNFFQVLEDVGADKIALDAARILRIPYTYNSKSESKVTIMKSTGMVYTMYDLCKEYLPDRVESKPVTVKQLETIEKIVKWKKSKIPKIKSSFQARKWISKNIHTESGGIKKILGEYLKDLETLYAIRKEKHCKREVACFLYRQWQLEINKDSSLAEQAMLKFNKSFSYPHKEDYIKKATKSAAKGKIYKYSKNMIIEMLEITEDEQKHLIRLNSTLQCKKERNRVAYNQKLANAGEDRKSIKVGRRLVKLLSLLQNDYKKTDILNYFNYTKTTFYKDMGKLLAHGYVEKDVYGAYFLTKKGATTSLEEILVFNQLIESTTEEINNETDEAEVHNSHSTNKMKIFKDRIFNNNERILGESQDESLQKNVDAGILFIVLNYEINTS